MAGNRRSIALLVGPGFLRLFAAQTISCLGSALSVVALPFAVLNVTHSAADLAAVNVARTAPALLFVLAGGVIGDRLSRRNGFIASNVAMGCFQAATALVLIAGVAAAWNLCLCVGLGSAAVAIEMPIAQALIPEVAEADRLQEANALMRMSRNGSPIFGAAAGGVLVATTGPGLTILIDGGSFLIAAALVAGVRVRAIPGNRSEAPWHQLRTGWRAFASRTWLWSVALQFCFVNAAYAVGFELIGPIVVRQYLGGARSWGLVVTAFAVGYLLGGVLALRYRPSRPLLAGMLGVLAMIFPLLALAWHLALLPVMTAVMLAGIGLEQFGVAWATALQEHVPLAMLSRVSSYDMLGSFLAVPLGFAVGGFAVTRASPSAILLICAGLIVSATCACMCRRDVRSLPRRTDRQQAIELEVEHEDHTEDRASGESERPARQPANRRRLAHCCCRRFRSGTRQSNSRKVGTR